MALIWTGLLCATTLSAQDNKPVEPLLDQPKSLRGLHQGLIGKTVARGFLAKPLRVGMSGKTESVLSWEIINETTMKAKIRFPELRAIERAPGDRSGKPMPKAWQTADELVVLQGVSTKGLVDRQVFWLEVPLLIVGTEKIDGQTVFLVAPAPSDRKK